VGQLIMIGTLAAIIVVIFGVVLTFDPEARRSSRSEGDE
jgi:hypothetical protein